MEMNFVLGIPSRVQHGAVLTLLQGVDDDYELLKGISRAEGFPGDAYFQFSPDFPRDVLLSDFLKNENKLLVASERACDLLRGAGGDHSNEFLPVTILDHKDRPLDERYFIVHQVDLQPCIDEANSEFEANAIDPERIYYMEKLVIDETRVDPRVALFRMARFAKVPVFRRDLAERVDAAGLTGIVFEEIEGWEGS